MSFTLEPLSAAADPDALAEEIAVSFGSDTDAARELIASNLAFLERVPRPDPWGCYVARSDGSAVGMAAFKSAPNAQGEVEIAYMTFPDCEGRGHAGSTIDSLRSLALDHGVATVIAHTLPEENASNRALRRSRFQFAGLVDDPEDGPVWQWRYQP